MTGSSGVHSPPSPKARSSAYCKQYAALPKNAPRILTKDSVPITRPAVLWPQRQYERRRLFQNVYQRYFQQILYGCVNTRCETPTCLSHQKRVSQGPFRRFTVLSARSLATFLASEDNSEKGLCPHEKPASLDFPNGDLLAKCPPRRSQARPGKVEHDNLEDFCLTEDQPLEIRHHVRNLNAESSHESDYSHLQDADQELRNHVSLREDSRSKKDPKSFTQNLFDTISMMVLQNVRVPNELGLSRWANWLRGEEHKASCEGCNSVSCRSCRGKALSNGEISVEQVPSSHTPESNGEYSLDYNGTDDPAEVKSGLLSQAVIKALSESHKERTLALDGHEDGSGTAHSVESQVNFDGRHILPGHTSSIEDRGLSDTAMRSSIRPQTLSHFTSENITSMVSLIKNASPVADEERQFLQSLGRAEEPIKSIAFVRGSAMPQDLTFAFGIQSIISVLGSTRTLLQSFRYHPSATSSTSTIPSAGFKEITGAFRTLMEVDYHPPNIFPSLWDSVGSLYLARPIHSRGPLVKTSPPRKARESESEFNLLSKISGSTSSDLDTLNDLEAVHIAKIALAALVASIPVCGPKTWLCIQNLRASGKIAPIATLSPSSPGTIDVLLEIEDSLDNELALALMTRLVKAVAARLCVSEISKNQKLGSSGELRLLRGEKNILEMILDAVSDSEGTNLMSNNTTNAGSMYQETFLDGIHEAQLGVTPQISSLSVIVEWLRSVVLREWDGKAEIPRWGAVGGALEFMSYIYRDCQYFKLDPEIFRTPSLSQRFDVMEMPAEWLSAPADGRVIHMLSYPFLFRPSTLVSYFRSINHAAMSKAFEASVVVARLVEEMSANLLNSQGEPKVSDRVRRAMNNYLVLEIRRDRVLTDAMDQLWRRERRELLRPLKVRMGMEEGEEGVDHGGVQQEFFRVAIGEALNPDYGLFQTDMQTRISWFQPCALEPLYKFEMLGLLTSLAIYNGLTLPITFPLALYRKLLDLPVTQVAHIEDGWPELARGFNELLTWTDGDVEDVFVRSYMFSVESPGSAINVDMDKIKRDVEWPPGSDPKGKGKSKILENGSVVPSQSSASNAYQALDSAQLAAVELWNSSEDPCPQEALRSRTNSVKSEACMVTNANREQYVQDYIFWLTDKSIRPQYEAFARGFYTCLDRKATTIFTPEALKSVVEGIQEIDLDALQQTTRYEGGFSADHRVVKDFWHVVRQFPPEKLRLLLEFMTASDRIPVNGVKSILFVIQQNGTEGERLPTSLTCFGRLLLPAYSSRKKLREKLCAAIENSKGFGVA